MSNVSDDQAKKESLLVRGICASIESMNYPKLQNLIELINLSFGDKVKITKL